MINNVVSVSGIQPSDSVIHVSILYQILLSNSASWQGTGPQFTWICKHRSLNKELIGWRTLLWCQVAGAACSRATQDPVLPHKILNLNFSFYAHSCQDFLEIFMGLYFHRKCVINKCIFLCVAVNKGPCFLNVFPSNEIKRMTRVCCNLHDG